MLVIVIAVALNQSKDKIPENKMYLSLWPLRNAFNENVSLFLRYSVSIKKVNWEIFLCFEMWASDFTAFFIVRISGDTLKVKSILGINL